MLRSSWGRLATVAALFASAAPAWADSDGLRYTREGTLFRVAAADDAAGVKQEYVIAEREIDDPDTAGLRVDVAVRTATALRDIAVLMLNGRDLAVRFTGPRAMEAATRPMGPALLSGTLKTTLNSLATQAGLQVYIRPQQIEFVDRRSYRLILPPYENATEIGARMHSTRAANVRIAAGNIEFDADADGLRDTQGLIRDLRAGRRGTAAFLARLNRGDSPPAAKAAPNTQPAEDPTSVAERIRNAERAVLAAMQGPQPASNNGVMARPISVEFEGDATEALRRIVQVAGISYRIVKQPAANLPVSLKLKQVPLRAALEALDQQLQGKADLVYVRMAQRVDFLAR